MWGWNGDEVLAGHGHVDVSISQKHYQDLPNDLSGAITLAVALS